MLRKLFHLAGIVIPVIYLLTDKQTALIVTAGVLVIDIILEALRIKGILKLPFIEQNMKKQERRRMSGSFFYVISSFIAMALFEKNIAISSLFILSISDPLSSVLGSRFGRIRFLGKSLEGTLVFFFSSFFILLAFSFTIPIAVAGATIASLTELFSSWPVDDNLSIPLVTALALTLLTRL
jgi:dolichol kinase